MILGKGTTSFWYSSISISTTSLNFIDYLFRWNNFRTYCGSEKKLRLALEVSDDLPDDQEIARWLGEPLICAFINTKSFQTNEKSYPVLSKAHQELVLNLMKRQVHVVISGSAREDTLVYYQQYINFLWQVGIFILKKKNAIHRKLFQFLFIFRK